MRETGSRSHSGGAELVVKSWKRRVCVRGDDDGDARGVRGVPDAHGDGDDGGDAWKRRWMNRMRPTMTSGASWWATSPDAVCSPDLSRSPSKIQKLNKTILQIEKIK